MGVLEGREKEKETERVFEEIMVKISQTWEENGHQNSGSIKEVQVGWTQRGQHQETHYK